MRELIRLVQAHMDQYGVSEAEVARRIGANPQTVNTWRNGEMKQLPRQPYLQKLAELTKTDYASVLAAALLDTGYIETRPAENPTANLTTMIELSFLADDVDAARNLYEPDDLSDQEEVETFVNESMDLVNAAQYLTRAVHDAVLDAVGGDAAKLRQIKREIRRFNLAKRTAPNARDIMGERIVPPPEIFDQVAARTAPADYTPGQSAQGEAGGEENQDR